MKPTSHANLHEKLFAICWYSWAGIGNETGGDIHTAHASPVDSDKYVATRDGDDGATGASPRQKLIIS